MKKNAKFLLSYFFNNIKVKLMCLINKISVIFHTFRYNSPTALDSYIILLNACLRISLLTNQLIISNLFKKFITSKRSSWTRVRYAW